MALAYLGTAALVLIAVWVIVTHNGFIRARNRAEESWGDVDAQLRRRHDLVPMLVETVRDHADEERTTLEVVLKARTEAMKAADGKEREKAEGALSSLLGELRGVAERYEDLQASGTFKVLEGQLAEIEAQLAAARRVYNSNVEEYNGRITGFPNSLVAASSFEARRLFVIEEPAEPGVPAVSFG